MGASWRWLSFLMGLTASVSSCRGGGSHAADAPEAPDAPDTPPPCSGPKGDHVLTDAASSLTLAGNSTQLFYQGCPPSAGPGDGVCVVTKSTGERRAFRSYRGGVTFPIAADDASLWYSPSSFYLHRAVLPAGEDVSLQLRVNAIAVQLGVSAPVTYFVQSEGLLVASTPTSTPIAIADSPGGDLLVMGGNVAYVLELAGKVHRFDVAGGTDLGTVDVGPLTSAAWSAGAIYIAQAPVGSQPGSMLRLADGTNDATKLFDIPSPDLPDARGPRALHDRHEPVAALVGRHVVGRPDVVSGASLARQLRRQRRARDTEELGGTRLVADARLECLDDHSCDAYLPLLSRILT